MKKELFENQEEWGFFLVLFCFFDSLSIYKTKDG